MAAGNGQKTVDAATTAAMLSAFDTALGECRTASGSVDSAHSMLMSQWGGDAAKTYDNSMAQWMDGFNKVYSGLQMLEGSMNEYRQYTTQAEGDNTGHAAGWAQAR